MTTYKWWLHASFLKHSTSSISTNAPLNQPFSKSQHHPSSMGPPTCNFLHQTNFKHFLALKNSCLLYTQTFWFPYVIISILPFDFKFVCSIHKKMQTSSKLVISYSHPWCAFSKFAPFFSLRHLLVLCFLLPLVFFYCISCFQQTQGSHPCFFILYR